MEGVATIGCWMEGSLCDVEKVRAGCFSWFMVCRMEVVCCRNIEKWRE